MRYGDERTEGNDISRFFEDVRSESESAQQALATRSDMRSPIEFPTPIDPCALPNPPRWCFFIDPNRDWIPCPDPCICPDVVIPRQSPCKRNTSNTNNSWAIF